MTDSMNELERLIAHNNAVADSTAAAVEQAREDDQHKVYAWLGYWRNHIPAEAVADLQAVLGPLRPLLPTTTAPAEGQNTEGER